MIQAQLRFPSCNPPTTQHIYAGSIGVITRKLGSPGRGFHPGQPCTARCPGPVKGPCWAVMETAGFSAPGSDCSETLPLCASPATGKSKLFSFSSSSHLRLNGSLPILWTLSGGCMGGWLPRAARCLGRKRGRKLFGITLYVPKSFRKAKLFPLTHHCWIVDCYIYRGSSSQPFQLPTLWVKKPKPRGDKWVAEGHIIRSAICLQKPGHFSTTLPCPSGLL